jgi:tripartite-type tricarboxylate transporter receptor subunit TctC
VQTQSLDWPNRVVRFIVPFAAGGPTDIVARVVTEQLSKIWGQQVVIENRGGAGTNIGNEMVARSDPDGYTVLFATASLAVNRSLYRSLSYDPIADFAAVSLVSRFSLFMFARGAGAAIDAGDRVSQHAVVRGYDASGCSVPRRSGARRLRRRPERVGRGQGAQG